MSSSGILRQTPRATSFQTLLWDAALKHLAVEVDPRQRAVAFVASAVRHVVVVSVRRRFLPWTDAIQPLRELAEARLLGERSGFLADAFEKNVHKKRESLPPGLLPRLVVQLFPSRLRAIR
jgi:hypothetical protein